MGMQCKPAYACPRSEINIDLQTFGSKGEDQEVRWKKQLVNRGPLCWF